MKVDRPLFLLIDGHSLIFRAWFAIKGGLTRSDGSDVRGVYGFLNMFLKVVREYSPTHAAVAFDTKAPTFRDEMFADYKAHRPPIDPELHAQIPLVKRLLQAFRVPFYEKDGYEADDIVGAISLIASKESLPTLILTGDADQLQLVSPDTRLLMYSGFGESKVYDVEAVKQKYNGLPPESVPDIKALEGDSSDNIPGVPGIGPKAARLLLSRFNTLENLLVNIEDVPNIEGLRGAKRVKALLEEHRDKAEMSKDLATIRRRFDIEFAMDDALFWQYKRAEVLEAAAELEFRSIVRLIPDPDAPLEKPLPNQARLGGFISTSGEPSPTMSSPSSIQYMTVTDTETLGTLLDALSRSEGFGFDTETAGINPSIAPLTGVSFAVEEGKGWYIPVGHDEGEQLSLEAVVAALRPIFADSQKWKAAHNANFDITVLEKVGIRVASPIFDTMIAAALCSYRTQGLKQLALDIYREEMTPIEELIGRGSSQKSMAQAPIEKASAYASADAEMTLRLRHKFKEDIERFGQQRVFYDIEIPLLPVIVKMQQAGLLLDSDILRAMSVDLATEIAEVQQAVAALFGGRAINLNSNRQLAQILIDELKAPHTRKTKTGWSMDANALEGYLARKELDDRILQLASAALKYRELTKLKSTYVDALPGLVDPKDGRIRTTFNQVGSATGRLSSRDPNVQNIPVRTQAGRMVRRAFKADCDNDWRLLSADYSQIELRVLAHLSKEPALSEAFLKEKTYTPPPPGQCTAWKRYRQSRGV